MRNTIRTFIAIKITPEEKLTGFFRDVKQTFSDERIKWVNENNLHLTLRFLGETTNEQVQKVNQSLAKIAGEAESFEMKLKGVGYFKSNRDPKVVFIKLEEISGLKSLAVEINEEVQKAGFDADEREFNPHLTLGRIKFLNNRDSFIQKADKWKELDFQVVPVDEIIFYQSILNDKEPVYKPLGKFKLK